MENDDPWLGHSLRTAVRGPRPVLPADSGLRPPPVMTAQLQPGGSSDSGQEPGAQQETRPPQEQDGWRILSYMLGGMILYGGLGWLVSRWTGIAVLFPVGMILGIGLSIAMIIFRVTRS